MLNGPVCLIMLNNVSSRKDTPSHERGGIMIVEDGTPMEDDNFQDNFNGALRSIPVIHSKAELMRELIGSKFVVIRILPAQRQLS